jgi:nitrogen regulatory protein PII
MNKAVLIIYNQTHTERVEFLLDEVGVRGFTKWEEVLGRGSVDGEPRMGTHTWPELNSSILAVVEEGKVKELLNAVKALDNINKEIGVKAFVWNIEQVL